ALGEFRGLLTDAAVGGVEDDLGRFLRHPDLVEQILEPGALPARAAHGAVAPFDARHVGLEQAAPVARALTERDHLDRRELLEVIETEPDLAIGAVPADAQRPGP